MVKLKKDGGYKWIINYVTRKSLVSQAGMKCTIRRVKIDSRWQCHRVNIRQLCDVPHQTQWAVHRIPEPWLDKRVKRSVPTLRQRLGETCDLFHQQTPPMRTQQSPSSPLCALRLQHICRELLPDYWCQHVTCTSRTRLECYKTMLVLWLGGYWL